jgi:hypothetical protein
MSGALRTVLKKAKAEGHSMRSMTVLSPQVDPYRFDTPKGRRNTAWFSEQITRFIRYEAAVHLRGLHYLLVNAADVVIPDGKGTPYINTDECWVWMSDQASKAARWLGYVPFERIRDQRNAAPEIYVPEYSSTTISLDPGVQVNIPPEELLLPKFTCVGSVRQPYRIAFYGEKSSLGKVLWPIAQRIGAELLLPTGESSSTMVAGAARRAAEADWSLVVLYFNDFDPSGNQMAVSVARKMQALRDLVHPNLNVQLHQVALTLKQVVRLGLPSYPLKETEKRSDKWRATTGREQTEIDALAALREDDLRDIVEEAIRPFYDETLAERTATAQERWEIEAADYLEANPVYAENRTEILSAYQELDSAATRINEQQAEAYEVLQELEPLEFNPPQPEVGVTAPDPLFTTDEDYVTATLRLKARKDYSA